MLLAPAYNRGSAAAPPAKMPPDGVPMNTQSREEFYANWDRQVGCPDQYDRAAGDAVWSEMLASDPVGATWGTGVRRAPQTAVWGWNQAAVGKTMVPTLMVAGAHDKQVPPDRVRDLYADLGAPNKIFVGPGVLVTQRGVGEEPSAAVPCVARVADGGDGERRRNRACSSSGIRRRSNPRVRLKPDTTYSQKRSHKLVRSVRL